MWRIQDSDGVIHSGTEDEMQRAFTLMTNSITELVEIYEEDEESIINSKNEYDYDWDGDLELVQIHNTYR